MQIPFEIRSLFPKAMSSVDVITMEPNYMPVLSMTSWSRETATFNGPIPPLYPS